MAADLDACGADRRPEGPAAAAAARRLNIVVFPMLSGEVTVKVGDRPWHDALDRILAPNGLVCRRAGNLIRIGRPGNLVEPRTFSGRPIDVDVKDGDLSTR